MSSPSEYPQDPDPASRSEKKDEGGRRNFYATRPKTPQLQVQTDSPHSGARGFPPSPDISVPHVVLSPPGYHHTTSNYLEDSVSKANHQAMPPPPLPSKGIKTEVTQTINPSVLSISSPEEVRILRDLSMDDPASPNALQHDTSMEQEEEMFRFDESMARPRFSTPSDQLRSNQRPGMFRSPTEYDPRYSSGDLNFSESVKVPEENHGRYTVRDISEPSVSFSSSEPSKTISGHSIQLLKGPIGQFQCCCCKAAFIAKQNLETHFSAQHKGRHTHPTEFEFTCRFCGEGFGIKSDRDTHLLACGVVPIAKRGKRIPHGQRFSIDSHPHRYSTSSLSPAGVETPNSGGRDSQLSLTSITSTPSEFELSDFNPADDEPTTIQKLVLKAKRQTMNALGKTADAEGEPISPSKRRKSNASSHFAKNVARNISKALEAGLIKMEELTGGLDTVAAPVGISDHPEGIAPKIKGFPQPKSKTKGKRSKEQSPFEDQLACPYAKGDPEKYLTCLLIHRRDMPGLREHLGRVHFEGTTPHGAIGSKDWPTLFLFCFPHWNNYIPDGRFDYTETIKLLQVLSLGEPINKFLRDLERHLAARRARELQEMEAIYTERSWRRYQEFLSGVQAFDRPPSSPPLQAARPPSPHYQSVQPLQHQMYSPEEPIVMTLTVSRDIEFTLNRQIEFRFVLGHFSASEFRHWLDAVFDPPVIFSENHLRLREYNARVGSLQDLEMFLNYEVPARLGNIRRHRDDNITVSIHENWTTDFLTITPGHH
ncbi:hypothetical protein H072_2662 [Dactylellina haptotyla CBS 200.50]|uniref:C2H2-type domain-containing protein n=1 Tax=Dactylellina haptotyla (strain CBS 200.50) TaxID=1284197 RepID=S8BVD5_DACHA|nr:hypothetical protein H072_2662 [Dactylellina haptotyla CBS 200.50]